MRGNSCRKICCWVYWKIGGIIGPSAGSKFLANEVVVLWPRVKNVARCLKK